MASLELKLRSVQESLELVLDVARERRLLLLEIAIIAWAELLELAHDELRQPSVLLGPRAHRREVLLHYLVENGFFGPPPRIADPGAGRPTAGSNGEPRPI